MACFQASNKAGNQNTWVSPNNITNAPFAHVLPHFFFSEETWIFHIPCRFHCVCQSCFSRVYSCCTLHN